MAGQVFSRFTLRGGPIAAARVRSVVLHTDLARINGGKPSDGGATLTLMLPGSKDKDDMGTTVVVDAEFLRLNAVKAGGYVVIEVETGNRYFLNEAEFFTLATIVPAAEGEQSGIPPNDPNPPKTFDVDTPAITQPHAIGTDAVAQSHIPPVGEAEGGA